MNLFQTRIYGKRVAVMAAILIVALNISACSASEPEHINEDPVSAGTSLNGENGINGVGAGIPMVGVDLYGCELPLSGEAQFIDSLYQLVLGQSGDYNEYQEWMVSLDSGDADGSDLLWKLFNREELEARNLDDQEYIITCYKACIGREPETEDLSYWTGRLADGERRVFVVYQLLKSDECEQAMSAHGIDRGSVGAVSNALQKEVASIARNNKGYRAAVTGECAAWVSGVYAAAGIEYPGGNAIDYWDWWKSSGSSDMSQVPVGAAVVGSGSMSSAGKTYGHIGIYIGDGYIAHNAGGGKATISTIEEFEDTYCNGNLETCTYYAYRGKQGILGWVWPSGNDFSN